MIWTFLFRIYKNDLSLFSGISDDTSAYDINENSESEIMKDI